VLPGEELVTATTATGFALTENAEAKTIKSPLAIFEYQNKTEIQISKNNEKCATNNEHSKFAQAHLLLQSTGCPDKKCQVTSHTSCTRIVDKLPPTMSVEDSCNDCTANVGNIPICTFIADSVQPLTGTVVECTKETKKRKIDSRIENQMYSGSCVQNLNQINMIHNKKDFDNSDNSEISYFTVNLSVEENDTEAL